VALKYLRNTDDAADAVMSIFEELTAKIGRYEIVEFRPWLYTVAKNYCMQKLRRKGREVPVDFSDRVMENAAFTHLLSEEKDETLFAALEKCMEKLPEKQRECIGQFFFNHRSYADITAATRYQLKSVKSHIQNGKRNLKICMEKEEQ
jgi:RNA polymerase sigma-70 factor (ECF subfamily)